MTKQIYLLLVSISLFAVANNTSAQVTIGSQLVPNRGALLDLKEYAPDADNVNSIRGLLLPRVVLTEKGSFVDISGLDEAAHVGLLVYATEQFDNPVNCPGPYVWDGAEWIPLLEEIEYPEITMTDGDGNTYKARWFTPDPCDPQTGNYWTVQDLYSTVAGDGSKLPGTDKDEWAKVNYAYHGDTKKTPLVITSKADLQSGSISYGWGLTAGTATKDNTTITLLEYAQMFGLKYNREQAFVVCPAGWHLPTPEEWGQLAQSMGGAAVAGQRMRSCYAEFFRATDLSSAKKWGPTTLIEDAGFGALPGGHTGADQEYSRQFSHAALWWMDQPHTWLNSSQTVSYDCRLIYNSNELLFGTTGTGVTNTGNIRRGLSVRCVKDK